MEDDEIITVGCIDCGKQMFKFSRKILIEQGKVYLQCPCSGETVVYINKNGLFSIRPAYDNDR